MANEKRLIDANELARKLYTSSLCVTCLRNGKTLVNEWLEKYRNEVLRMICKAPVVDAVEVVHGEWGEIYTCHGERLWGYKCSQCEQDNPNKSNYCPNCGAKMDGDGNG